jgi:hypothetical protein
MEEPNLAEMMKELPAVLDPEFSLYPSEELPKN